MTDVFLYPGDAGPSSVILRDPTTSGPASSGFVPAAARWALVAIAAWGADIQGQPPRPVQIAATFDSASFVAAPAPWRTVAIAAWGTEEYAARTRPGIATTLPAPVIDLFVPYRAPWTLATHQAWTAEPVILRRARNHPEVTGLPVFVDPPEPWIHAVSQWEWDNWSTPRRGSFVRLESKVVFPTQYAGLRVQKNGITYELCLVALADAPAGMGGQVRIAKNGATYAVYLVETIDGNASTVRIETTAGIKAARLKT